jgi:hypothetical protein
MLDARVLKGNKPNIKLHNKKHAWNSQIFITVYAHLTNFMHLMTVTRYAVPFIPRPPEDILLNRCRLFSVASELSTKITNKAVTVHKLVAGYLRRYLHNTF